MNPPVWQPNLFVEEVINAGNFLFEKPEQSDTATVADHKSYLGYSTRQKCTDSNCSYGQVNA